MVKVLKSVSELIIFVKCNLYEDLEILTEYQGKKVKLNDSIRTSENTNKKFKVCQDGDTVKVVRFGIELKH